MSKHGSQGVGLRVALVNSLYPPLRVGGAEEGVRWLAEGLKSVGCTVTVVTLSQNRSRQDEVDGVEVVRVPLRNAFWPWNDEVRGRLQGLVWHFRDRWNRRMAREIRRLICERRPDVVNTHNLLGFSPAVWDEVSHLGVPVVHTAQDYSLLCPRNMYTGDHDCGHQCLRCQVWSSRARAASKCVKRFLPISRHVRRRYHAAGFFKDCSSTVIYHAVPAQRYRGNGRVTSARPTGPFTVGFLGRISRRKGVDALLDACRDLSEMRLILAGTGDTCEVAELKRVAQDRNVEWLGFSAPEAVLRRCDVLAIPSRWSEPLGRVALEAYAFGVPVVAPESGGLVEIVRDGVTGRLYQANDPLGLRRALREVSGWDLKRAAQSCISYAAEFGIRKQAERYMKVFRDVAL